MMCDTRLGPAFGGQTRALIVDDDPILRSIVKSRLRARVDEIVEASDGLTAWRLLTNESFDLALVDLMMPGLNGFALIQCMRGHPRTRHMPIVVVTSSDDKASVEKALEVGASAFLTKPVSWSVFDTHIAHLMRMAAASRSAELALARNRSLSEAQAAFAAAGAACAHAAFRRLARAVESVSAPPDVSVIADGIASGQRACERLRALASLVARPEMIDTRSQPLQHLLTAIQGEAARRSETVAIDIATVPVEAVEILCNPEAIVAAGLACIRAVAGEHPAHAIEIAALRRPAGLDVEIRAPDVARPGYCDSDLLIDLAIAAQLPEGSPTFDIAIARTLVLAHGGRLSLVADAGRGPAVVLHLPLDRVHFASPGASPSIQAG